MYRHSYDYQPDQWVKNYAGHERGLLMGLEVETQSDVDRDEGDHMYDCLNEMGSCNVPMMIAKRDGSLDESGIEWVFHPMTLRYARKNKVQFDNWQSVLSDNDYSAWDHSECGIHIHTPEEAWTSIQLYRARYLMYNFQHLTEFFGRRSSGRSGSSYSLEGGSNAHAAREREDGSRYKAINFGRTASGRRSPTIEFRIFRSTTKVESIIRYMEFVDALYHFTQEYSPASMRVNGMCNSNNQESYARGFKLWIAENKQRYPRLAKKSESGWDSSFYERISVDRSYDWETVGLKKRYEVLLRAMNYRLATVKKIIEKEGHIEIIDNYGERKIVMLPENILSRIEDYEMRMVAEVKRKADALEAQAEEYRRLREATEAQGFIPRPILTEDIGIPHGVEYLNNSGAWHKIEPTGQTIGATFERHSDVIQAVRYHGAPESVLYNNRYTGEVVCA